MDEFAPTQLVEHNQNGKISYSIILDPFGPIYLTTSSIFKAHGMEEPGGYAWHGVAEALVRLHAPEIASLVKYDPESSMFSAYGDDRAALLRVAQLIRQAQDNPAILEEALENANPEMLD